VSAADRAAGSTPDRLRSWGLPLALFALTALTTTLAQGPAYALTLLSILVAHEMGHFLVAKRLGVSASPPHFIPLPPLPGVFSLGTLGAVIRMDDRRASRRQLLRIGAAGPLAGFVVAVPAMVLGLEWSEPAALEAGEGLLFFGSSLLSAALEAGLGPEVPPGQEIVAHPVYIAAWAGFLVTALNLLPMGQLDGGHVLHALAPNRSGAWARGLHRALLVLGVLGLVVVLTEQVDLELAHALAFLRPWLSPGLLVWAALVAWIGVEHPPVPAPETPLRRFDLLLAAACAAVLVACFTPSPIYTEPPPLEAAPSR
jgi:membrane-associated protease RseP (regulator of RpoE activity)